MTSSSLAYLLNLPHISFYILSKEKGKPLTGISIRTTIQYSGSYKHVLGDIPMPAAARYCARGQPSPPQPTINTEVFSKFNCPVNNNKNHCCVHICNLILQDAEY